MADAFTVPSYLSDDTSPFNTVYGSFSINLRPVNTYQYNLNSKILYVTLAYNYGNTTAPTTMALVQGQTAQITRSFAAGSNSGYNSYLTCTVNTNILLFSATGDTSMSAFKATVMYAAIVI